MCTRVDNQWSSGVGIARVERVALEPSSPMSRSPPIDLSSPHRRSGTLFSIRVLVLGSDFAFGGESVDVALSGEPH